MVAPPHTSGELQLPSGSRPKVCAAALHTKRTCSVLYNPQRTFFLLPGPLPCHALRARKANNREQLSSVRTARHHQERLARRGSFLSALTRDMNSIVEFRLKSRGIIQYNPFLIQQGPRGALRPSEASARQRPKAFDLAPWQAGFGHLPKLALFCRPPTRLRA